MNLTRHIGVVRFALDLLIASRTNVLIRRFWRCSLDVKLRLFRTYCMCFLADRPNGRAIATLLRLSSSVCLSVCDVMYCG